MRALSWDGYINVRDLGGLPTSLSPSGTTVAGRIARGPRRERITQRGWADAAAWGLTSIVDLRCAHEVGRRDADPDATPPGGVAIRLSPTEDQSDPEFRETCFPILDSPEYWAHNWRLQPDLVAGALRAIAEAEPGILVHCSAGRDRTGMITALLLGNAGVPGAAVVNDYAISVREMADAPHAIVDEPPRSDVDEWIRSVAPIVRSTAERAPGILDDLGVDAHVRARLRDVLTRA